MQLRLKPLEKKNLPCLRCGEIIWTDAAHRFCRKCRRHNAEVQSPSALGVSGDDGKTST